MERSYLTLIKAEFEQEVLNSRRLLEAMPSEGLTFKPTVEGWSMGELAQHIIHIYHWCAKLFSTNDYHVEKDPYQAADAKNKVALLSQFEENVRRTRTILEQMTAEDWEQPWSMTLLGNRIVGPALRIDLLRGFLFNHLVHHRGEMIVYLRVGGFAVPGLYGPTREQMAG
jgi:uncharacterized damage-inducible protein DinB